jgi:Uma2 family endonuclease
MVATPIALETPVLETSALETPDSAAPYSLEDWMQNPPDNTEWTDGERIEKSGMTLKHSEIQGNMYFAWRNYKDSSGQGGTVYTEAPCRTSQKGRVPDVAYLPPSLVAQYGNLKVLPQSFPLIAEIVSPTDLAEEVIAKAQEYLQSGGEEVWLVFPESRWVIVVTQEARLVFAAGEVVKTQRVLVGFEVAVDLLVG